MTFLVFSMSYQEPYTNPDLAENFHLTWQGIRKYLNANDYHLQ